MSKNIVICSDGTAATSIKNRGTNVFKLYEAVEVNEHKATPTGVHQVAFYDDGVGTQALKPLRLLGAAFGFGLSANIRQIYGELVRTYEPGDNLYLFGFSRGGFTVRLLAGLVTQLGILKSTAFDDDAALRAGIKNVYRTYRQNYATLLQQKSDRIVRRSEWLAQRRGSYYQQVSDKLHPGSERVRFIGVWDTVDAVGFPIPRVADIINRFIYRFKFPTMKLSRDVEIARQALSIDDERLTYQPLVWEGKEEDGQSVEQVWFAGAHANVGGGYPKQGVSLVALDWMMTEAELAGLRFIPQSRTCYRAARNVHDAIYDSRSMLSFFYRYRARDIGSLTSARNAGALIHVSVLERLAQQTDGYAPGGIPRDAKFVATRDGSSWPAKVDAASHGLSKHIAAELDSYAGDEAGSRRDRRKFRGLRPDSLLDLVPQYTVARHSWHIGFLMAVLALAVVVLAAAYVKRDISLPTSFGRCCTLIRELWRGMLRGDPFGVGAYVLAALIGALIAAIAIARRRMRRVLSAFWYPRAAELRHRLQQAGLWIS